MAKWFYHIKPVAGYLLWPYVAFLAFANALNWCVKLQETSSVFMHAATKRADACLRSAVPAWPTRLLHPWWMCSPPACRAHRRTGSADVPAREREGHFVGHGSGSYRQHVQVELKAARACTCRFHLQNNADRTIEEDLHEPASKKNPGEAGYVAPPGNPQGYLKNDPAAVNKGSGVSGAQSRSVHAPAAQKASYRAVLQQGLAESKLSTSG